MDESRELQRLAVQVRQRLIRMACRSRSPHIGSCLSCTDLLTALYFGVLRIDERQWDERDIFILSKAHSAMTLYAILNLKGVLDDRMLDGYFLEGGTLPAHLDRDTHPWVEASAGSLGHGFCMGLGMAHGLKRRGSGRQVFSVIGDGETQEGSIWEGAMFAAKLGLDNFTAITDFNNLQGYGRAKDLCAFEPLEDKWRAFGWDVCRIPGHDMTAILEACRRPRDGRPRMIIADTVKGKGVSFMEDQLKWHYYIVTDAFREQAMAELERAAHAI